MGNLEEICITVVDSLEVICLIPSDPFVAISEDIERF